MIRRLSGSDAAAWRALRLEALRNDPPAFDVSLHEWEARSVGDDAVLLEAHPWFGAFDKDKLVGKLGIRPERFASAAHRAVIVSVYVAPSHRGTGLAGQLMEHAIDEARAMGLTQLELGVRGDDPIALRFYERNGFYPIGTIPRAFCHGGIYRDEVLMVRSLTA